MAAETAGFHHVHLWVSDVEAAVSFYRAAFGAEETFRIGERLVFVRLSGGEVIALDARPEGERNPEHVGLRLAEHQDLDAAVADIVKAGGSLVERGAHAGSFPYAYVSDPDGNVLEL